MALAQGELGGLLFLADLHAMLAPGAEGTALGRGQQVRGKLQLSYATKTL